MRKPLTFVMTLLLVASIALAIVAGPASSLKDLATIPVNDSIQVTPNIKANLDRIVIEDESIGGSYAPDPTKVIYPVLWYTYQNVGSVPESGHLHVKFVDDQGQVYEKRDEGTMEPVQPGKTSASRPLEINIPKDRKLTALVVVMGFDQQTIPLTYPGTVTPAGTAAPSASAPAGSPGSLCLGSLLLPLFLVGLSWAGLRLVKRQG